MKQDNENKLIDIIYETINKFIKDWRNSPYEWETEIDIQCEIASRLRQAIKSHGVLISEASYDYIRDGKRQQYSRLSCEPRIYYNDSNGDGKRYNCRPDIVVFDVIDNPDLPPDVEPGKNWPLLWVCEIKYQTEDNYALQDEDWDNKKMNYLLEQRETKYVCCLYFNRKEMVTKLTKIPEDKNGGR